MIERIRVVGSTVSITRVGFGCARIYGGSELRESARLIEAALSAGIRHFDTAPPYGGGRSEEALGEVLAGVDDITLTTKIGIERVDDEAAPSPARLVYRRLVKPLLTRVPGVKSMLLELIASNQIDDKSQLVPRRRLDGSYVRRELEGSLKRLKRDRVDLYLIHEPDQFVLDDEALEFCSALRREGVIATFGLAFGRSASVAPDFGTVVQSRYRDDCSSQNCAERTRIFHGVLRHGWNKRSEGDDAADVGRYLENFLEANPEAAVVFSASSVRQIRQATATL